VAYTGFFGFGALALLILCFSFIVDQDRDGAVGAGVTPGFLARQVRARAEMSADQRWAFRAEQAREAQSTYLFKVLGVSMIVIGFVGFWLFQL